MPDINVLIIDDDTLLCRTLSRRLSTMGISVATASTGSEGLNIIQQQMFDIIFVDTDLPDINTIELQDKIQVLSLQSKLIVITSETDGEYRRTAIRKGAVDYIEKPFGFSEVKKRINSIFYEGIEKRRYLRFTCNILCNVIILKKPEVAEEGIQTDNFLCGTAVDINKRGLGIRFNNDITGIANGRFIRLLTGVRDHLVFDFLPSNIIAEIVWVKEQDHEILAGLKYLASNYLDRIIKA